MLTASALVPKLLVVAMVAVCALLALGAFLADRTPVRLDVEAAAVRGDAVPLAIFFTALGRWPVVIGLGAFAAILAESLRTGLAAVLTLLAVQVLSQGTSTLLKLAFHRPRPDAWLHVLEPDFSYPSGHAVTAVVFFVGFALLVSHAPLPRPLTTALVVALAICAVGIMWSRLALSAHYATDVIGGALLGTAWLSVAFLLIAGITAHVSPSL